MQPSDSDEMSIYLQLLSLAVLHQKTTERQLL